LRVGCYKASEIKEAQNLYKPIYNRRDNAMKRTVENLQKYAMDKKRLIKLTGFYLHYYNKAIAYLLL
jgi:hypothetical protein